MPEEENKKKKNVHLFTMF